ncbi:MAG: gfo/Idh/MocA family oxidoreductase, partial [Pirellulales bacterium]|nr:gfo/Idh/MocA family oxidoreductase [Pirellulales bacterium]
TLSSEGVDLDRQQVSLNKNNLVIQPQLEGSWFPDGFHGTMGELLCAIEEDRPPENSAKNNLQSLAVCFAAVASAECGRPIKPGSVRQLPDGDFEVPE